MKYRITLGIFDDDCYDFIFESKTKAFNFLDTIINQGYIATIEIIIDDNKGE